MEIIYYTSAIIIAIILVGLPVLTLITLIKPQLLNTKSFIKKPLSRGKIALFGLLIFLCSIVSFGSVMAATEPESIKNARLTRQKNEQMIKEETAKHQAEEAKKPITKQETKTEVIAFETTQQQDNTIPKGETRVDTEGLDGERIITYDVTYQEGKEIDRKEVKNETTKQPIAKILKIGTYVAPAQTVSPAPLKPQANTSSVYYRNCTAARAAGAAPVYIGEPGYGAHLDRDNDGIGCE